MTDFDKWYLDNKESLTTLTAESRLCKAFYAGRGLAMTEFVNRTGVCPLFTPDNDACTYCYHCNEHIDGHVIRDEI